METDRSTGTFSPKLARLEVYKNKKLAGKAGALALETQVTHRLHALVGRGSKQCAADVC